ncbi:MAG: hypothetical protein O6952_02730 [Planctomycetota bacterium]|nr:hypothetical protein [Planctomycetota bacterium]
MTVDNSRSNSAEATQPSASLLLFGWDELCLLLVLIFILSVLQVPESSGAGFDKQFLQSALSPNGSLLASATPWGGGVHDLETGRLLYRFAGRVCSLEFSPDNRMLLLAEPEGVV